MTRKQELRYRTGRLQSGRNCGICSFIVPAPEVNCHEPHRCLVLGFNGPTCTHDGICDRFDNTLWKGRLPGTFVPEAPPLRAFIDTILKEGQIVANPNAKREQKLVDQWNAAHQPGETVIYTRDSGLEETTTTRSNAELLSGHTAVIWLEGVRGCVMLTRVRPAAEAA